MDERTMNKYKDINGMCSAVSCLLRQAWERGRKYGKAEAEEQTGEWIMSDRSRSRCSKCGHIADLVVTINNHFIEQISTFCPECGTRMVNNDG